ncbi:hypothetical protein DACRYDRAFT_118093 [Dacryopinax primogenitus]|uniref:CxC1-like cysteine cluster associated with KDZ transposases domain-containing protein n=1 Tax=Dacryopinax primogenitus (strain DJM 731) TaxID=1858805 RepID=M5FUY8_DACPD|nr:uncharacterized protein DACRYDRAFT_118093 [Dacryopinax primogenitus]EJT99359.1 hypothetical protein DACRYDRAFT_118093 [Dacryopinax primogenitus]
MASTSGSLSTGSPHTLEEHLLSRPTPNPRPRSTTTRSRLGGSLVSGPVQRATGPRRAAGPIRISVAHSHLGSQADLQAPSLEELLQQPIPPPPPLRRGRKRRDTYSVAALDRRSTQIRAQEDERLAADPHEAEAIRFVQDKFSMSLAEDSAGGAWEDVEMGDGGEEEETLYREWVEVTRQTYTSGEGLYARRILQQATTWSLLMDELIPPESRRTFELQVVSWTGLERRVFGAVDRHASPVRILLRHGFLARSPEVPRMAVNIRILEVYHQARLRGYMSLEAWTRVVCDLHGAPYEPSFRRRMADAYDAYTLLLVAVEKRVSQGFGRDTPDWRVKHTCPACSYKLQDEPSLPFSRLLCGDGNNSSKRFAYAGHQDLRVYESDYILPIEHVERFKNDVRSHQTSRQNRRTSREGDPTDGLRPEEGTKIGLDETLGACADKWKPSQARESGQIFQQALAETGHFLTVCRHAFICYSVDMIRSGELAKYSIASLDRLIDIYGADIAFGYDIGYWFYHTWDSDRRAVLGEFIFQNYRQALKIIQTEGPAVGTLLKNLNLTSNDLDQFCLDEKNFFSNLQREPEMDEKAFDYLDVLKLLQSARDDLAASQAQSFNISTPEQWSQGAIQNQGRSNERLHLQKLRKVLELDAIATNSEENLNTERWTPDHPSWVHYSRAAQHQEFQRALDHLESLVVQRLFEMEKVNARGTNYKMRTSIAKALQSRSTAIRTALGNYNPVLDHAFLGEFTILRHGSEASDASRRWMVPQVWEVVVKHLLLKCAREEIRRLDVEVRRVLTAVEDKLQDMQRHVDQIALSGNAALAAKMRSRVEERSSINTRVLKRLQDITRLPGYSGSYVRGVPVSGMYGDAGPGQGTRCDGEEVESPCPERSGALRSTVHGPDASGEEEDCSIQDIEALAHAFAVGVSFPDP